MNSNFPFVRLAGWQKLTLVLAFAGLTLILLSFRKFDFYDHHCPEAKEADAAIDWSELQVRILFGTNPAMNGVYFRNGDYYLDNDNGSFKDDTGVDIAEVAKLQEMALCSSVEMEK